MGGTADSASGIELTDLATHRYVRFGPYTDPMDANLVNNRLNEEGIAAHIANENLATTLGPIYGAAYCGIEILVPVDDEATARTIIDGIETRRRQRIQAQTPPCPFCGHRPTDRVLSLTRWVGFAFLLSTLLLNRLNIPPVTAVIGFVLLVYPRPPVWKCRACHHRFAIAASALDDDEDDTDDPGQ